MTKNQQEQKSVFDLKDPHPEHDVKPDPEQAKLKKELDKALKQTFPASDPPSVSQPMTIGKKKRPDKKAA